MKNETKTTPSQIAISVSKQIEDQTGFILEHNVATILELHGWTVIHNRFYLDDVQSIQREIDVLAYKVSEKENILVYTSLIVSCKKSAFKDWLFLTRNSNGTKSNLEMYPYTIWSNSEILNFQLKDIKFNDLQFCDSKKLESLKKAFEYNKTVFAFREYDSTKQSQKLLNDTAIYESIITLIKSQSYELESLPSRKKDKEYFYNINLLTIADVRSFIEVECLADITKENKIKSINYVNRFLVNKKEHYSRITFVTFESFNDTIENFNDLHNLNCEIISNSKKSFFEVEIFKNTEAKNIIIDNHGRKLLFRLKWDLWHDMNISDQDFSDLDLIFEEDILHIAIGASEAIIEELNFRGSAKDIAKSWLLENIHYKGKFDFEVNDDLPF